MRKLLFAGMALAIAAQWIPGPSALRIAVSLVGAVLCLVSSFTTNHGASRWWMVFCVVLAMLAVTALELNGNAASQSRGALEWLVLALFAAIALPTAVLFVRELARVGFGVWAIRADARRLKDRP